jgi:hypothetical protein
MHSRRISRNWLKGEKVGRVRREEGLKVVCIQDLKLPFVFKIGKQVSAATQKRL